MSDTEPTGPDALTQQELQIAELMMLEKTCREIGTTLGMSHSQAWSISKRAHVQAFIDRLRAAMQGILERKAVVIASDALDVLHEIMRDKTAPKNIRVNAAGHALRAAAVQRHEVSGPGGAPVQTMQVDPAALEGLSEEELLAAQKLLGRLIR